ncbi:septum formation initiator family protein [Patescibacteria group bacterium]|nr:septum formation initiator family protein [Patescibacteria group bacterium]
MKRLLFGLMLIVTGTLLYGTVKLYLEHESLAAEYSSVEAHLRSLQTDTANLSSDIQYYQDPANLEKELRSKFNYKAPGEHLVIVVPGSDASSSVSSATSSLSN